MIVLLLPIFFVCMYGPIVYFDFILLKFIGIPIIIGIVLLITYFEEEGESNMWEDDGSFCHHNEYSKSYCNITGVETKETIYGFESFRFTK